MIQVVTVPETSALGLRGRAPVLVVVAATSGHREGARRAPAANHLIPFIAYLLVAHPPGWDD